MKISTFLKGLPTLLIGAIAANDNLMTIGPWKSFIAFCTGSDKAAIFPKWPLYEPNV